MALFLLFALIAVPIAEIAVFIQAGEIIGLWPTLALVIVTAVAGSTLLRVQGLSTLRRAQESLARHEFPVAEVFDGLCLLVAGALLLTPGFLTDTLGLLLFVPPFRRALGAFLAKRMVVSGHIHMTAGMDPGSTRKSGPVVEGEYEVVDEEQRNRGIPDSGWTRTRS